MPTREELRAKTDLTSYERGQLRALETSAVDVYPKPPPPDPDHDRSAYERGAARARRKNPT